MLFASSMWNDLLVAARTLLKRPGYAISVVATLGLGIGASTVMFTLLDAAFLRRLPFQEPNRLVFLTGVAGPERAPRGGSFPEVLDWRSMNTTLQDVSIYDETSLNMRAGNESIRVEAESVSPSYFPLLGTTAAIGRTFLPAEDSVPDRDHVAVISHALWRGRFGQAADILSRTVELNERPFSIVGVMPEGFAGVSFDTDVWVPASMVSLTNSPAVLQNRGSRWLGAIGRLKEGVTLERSREDLTRVAAVLEQQYPETNRQRGVDVTPIDEALQGDTGRLLGALFGAVLLFLVVACANVATLQLARASSRRRELAVRVALGAGRWHVVRQLLSESLVLSCTAGAAGVLAAAWGLGGLLAMMPDGALPDYVAVSLDGRALAFAVVVSVISGLLVAMLPALLAIRADLSGAMKEGARSAGPGLGSIRRPSVQHALVIGEIALALTLLTGAGLMVRSLNRQMNVPVGFQAEGVTVGRLTLPAARYPQPKRLELAERVLAGIRSAPRVESAALTTDVPFAGGTSAAFLFPDSATGPESRQRFYRHLVTPDFFKPLGVPLVRGRGFTETDRLEAPPVAIINESAAKRMWNTADVIGRQIRLGSATGPAVEIVGVVGDVRFRDLTTDLTGARVEPDVFFPFSQRSSVDLEIAVRTTDGSAFPLESMQAAVAAVDPNLPVYRVQRLGEILRGQTASQRMGSSLLTMFSVGALLLSALGLYGLISYVVGLSRQEIAIRLALGASRSRVVAMIVRNGLVLVAAGILVGTGGAFAAARALEAQLFRTGPLDPSTLAAVSALLLIVTFLATLLPARRAARVSPHAALRGD